MWPWEWSSSSRMGSAAASARWGHRSQVEARLIRRLLYRIRWRDALYDRHRAQAHRPSPGDDGTTIASGVLASPLALLASAPPRLVTCSGTCPATPLAPSSAPRLTPPRTRHHLRPRELPPPRGHPERPGRRRHQMRSCNRYKDEGFDFSSACVTLTIDMLHAQDIELTHLGQATRFKAEKLLQRLVLVADPWRSTDPVLHAARLKASCCNKLAGGANEEQEGEQSQGACWFGEEAWKTVGPLENFSRLKGHLLHILKGLGKTRQ